MKKIAPIFSRPFTLLTVIFLLSNGTASAQITISSSQFSQLFSLTFPDASSRYRDSTGIGLQPLIGQTGANQTWSFIGLPFLLNTSDNSTLAAYTGGAAMADSFQTATQVVISPSATDTFYDFYQLNQTGFYDQGTCDVKTGAQPSLGKFTPQIEQIPFPLTSATPPWTTTTSSVIAGSLLKEVVNGLVDGWGSLSLPGSATTLALRVRTESIISITFPDNSKINYTSYSFQWFTQTGVSAEINTDDLTNDTSGYYTIPGSSIVLDNASSPNYSISLGSNPVTSSTNVSFTIPSESQVRISLMDPLGRQSQLLMNGMAHPGLNTLPLDPANLVNGTYFLRIQSDGYSAVQKMIVAH